MTTPPTSTVGGVLFFAKGFPFYGAKAEQKGKFIHTRHVQVGHH